MKARRVWNAIIDRRPEAVDPGIFLCQKEWVIPDFELRRPASTQAQILNPGFRGEDCEKEEAFVSNQHLISRGRLTERLLNLG